jgi:hypothetical protein
MSLENKEAYSRFLQEKLVDTLDKMQLIRKSRKEWSDMKYSDRLKYLNKKPSEEYKKYVEWFEGMQEKGDIDEEEKESTSACWNGAKYIRFLSGDGIEEDFGNDITDMKDILKLEDGIYHFSASSDVEIHYFALIIEGNNLTYIATYGGVDEITFKRFNKVEWVSYLEKMIKEGNYKYYEKAFNAKLNSKEDFKDDIQNFDLSYKKSDCNLTSEEFYKLLI